MTFYHYTSFFDTAIKNAAFKAFSAELLQSGAPFSFHAFW